MAAGARVPQRGFTLIEVLVSFVLLSLSLVVILQIFATGLRSSGAAEGYTRAMLLAESTLARLGSEIPLVAGETEGRDDIFQWRLRVTPALTPPAEPGPQAVPRATLYDVALEVEWRQGARTPQIRFRTLRAGPVE